MEDRNTALDLESRDTSMPKCAKCRDIANMLNVTPRYINAMANAGKFGGAAFKVGNTWRFNTAKICEMYHLT
jgi:hypothetical protein